MLIVDCLACNFNQQLWTLKADWDLMVVKKLEHASMVEHLIFKMFIESLSKLKTQLYSFILHCFILFNDLNYG